MSDMCIKDFTDSVLNCNTCRLHAFVYVCVCVNTRLQEWSYKNTFIQHTHACIQTYVYAYVWCGSILSSVYKFKVTEP